jgi:hypothetical protein
MVPTVSSFFDTLCVLLQLQRRSVRVDGAWRLRALNVQEKLVYLTLVYSSASSLIYQLTKGCFNKLARGYPYLRQKAVFFTLD